MEKALRFLEAYRLKRDAPMWAFVKGAHVTATAKIRSILESIIIRTIEDPTYHDEIRRILSLPHQAEILPLEVVDYFHALYRGQLGSNKRSPWCFDVSLSIREHEGRVLIIPYCDMLVGSVLDFFKTHPQLESFQYWENGEIPISVSPNEWVERHRVWTDCVSNWQQYLTLDICTYSNFKSVDINPVWTMMDRAPWRERFDKRDTRRIEILQGDEEKPPA